jgi:hypothetical protein
MNCRRIEKLIPLFVEGDLDAGAMSMVSLHLNDCRNCSQMMSEYGESQNWLRTFTPPEFDNAFFVDLKQSVMQEIEGKPARPTLMQQLTERLTWNPTWAMAIVMLVLVGAFAFYLYSGKTESNSTDEKIAKDKEEQKQHQQEQREEKPQPKMELHNSLKDRLAVKHSQKQFQQTLERIIKDKSPVIKPAQSLNFDLIAEVIKPEQSLNFDLFAASLNDENPINTGLFEDLKIPVNTLRMEFQTSDPNIRIIWFAPKADPSQSLKIDTD